MVSTTGDALLEIGDQTATWAGHFRWKRFNGWVVHKICANVLWVGYHQNNNFLQIDKPAEFGSGVRGFGINMHHGVSALPLLHSQVFWGGVPPTAFGIRFLLPSKSVIESTTLSRKNLINWLVHGCLIHFGHWSRIWAFNWSFVQLVSFCISLSVGPHPWPRYQSCRSATWKRGTTGGLRMSMFKKDLCPKNHFFKLGRKTRIWFASRSIMT